MASEAFFPFPVGAEVAAGSGVSAVVHQACAVGWRQLPLPPHLRELESQRSVDPAKDVDGIHPTNVGLMVRGEPTFQPATPYGIVELLLRTGVDLEGQEVVVVGYGELVGAPLSIMLA